MTEKVVCLHGFYVDEDGNETHTDGGPEEPEATGWCVYVRDGDDPMTDFLHEQDYLSEEEAEDAAEKLSIQYDCEIRRY